MSAFRVDDRVLIGAGIHAGKVGTVVSADDGDLWVLPDGTFTPAPYIDTELTLHLQAEGQQVVEDFAAESVAVVEAPKPIRDLRPRFSHAGYASAFGGAA